MSYAVLIKNFWRELYSTDKNTVSVVKKYLHENYQQCINGVTMDSNKYIQHVEQQKNNINVTTIDYKHIVEYGDELFAIYYPKATDRNNNPVDAEVIAYFKIKDNKIFNIHGNVRLISGKPTDVDM